LSEATLKHLTTSIEQLTDSARRESFSSISSIGQRQQFETALSDLQKSVFGKVLPKKEIEQLQKRIMENHNNFDDESPNEPHPPAPITAHLSFNPNELGGTRGPHLDSASSQGSQGSDDSNNGFVKLDHPDMEHENLDIPDDLIGAYGHQIASEVLEQFTGGQATPPTSERTPAQESVSPLSAYNIMDDKDLLDFMPPPSVADQHRVQADFYPPDHEPQPPYQQPLIHTQVNTDEFDPLAAHREALDAHRESPKRDVHPEEPQPRAPTPEEEADEIQERIEAAVKDVHGDVEDVLHKLHEATQESAVTPSPPPYVPSSASVESGHDTLGGLISDYGAGGDEENAQIPTSESISGMREISPDEHTYERRGPLTIPENAASALLGTAPEPEEEDDRRDIDDLLGYEDSKFSHFTARPPTPPKELSDEEDKPQSIDIGPPPHAHVHDEHQFPRPILKHTHDGKPWVDFKTVDPRVLDIVYWRDPKKSGVALALILLALILFAKFSFISLLAYTSLAVLGGTLGFRIFKLVEGRVKNTDGSNPFKPYLEHEVTVPQDRVHAQVDVLVEHAQLVATQLRRLFLVEHLVDSVKFALLLWTLTYVGAWFSGLALIIIFVLGVFSIPKFYEVYKEPVDHYLDLARENVEKVNHIIEEKVPFLKRQQEVKKEQ
jgi:hypothetical protein